MPAPACASRQDHSCRSFFQATALGHREFFRVRHVVGEIAGGFFRIHFHTGVRRNQLIRNRHTLDHFNALLDQRAQTLTEAARVLAAWTLKPRMSLKSVSPLLPPKQLTLTELAMLMLGPAMAGTVTWAVSVQPLASVAVTFTVELISTFGVPLSTPNEIAIRAVAEALRPHAKVAMSGEGADELFAGYGPPLAEAEAWIARATGVARTVRSQAWTRGLLALFAVVAALSWAAHCGKAVGPAWQLDTHSPITKAEQFARACAAQALLQALPPPVAPLSVSALTPPSGSTGGADWWKTYAFSDGFHPTGARPPDVASTECRPSGLLSKICSNQLIYLPWR